MSDISPLAGLTNLGVLIFTGNSVSDISALVENEGIASEAHVDMWNNYLDLTPGTQNMNDINALLGRGVEVSYWRQRK